MKVPTAAAIKKARYKAGLTQAQAAEKVYRSFRTWQDWEAGKSIDMACWELFLIKTKLTENWK